MTVRILAVVAWLAWLGFLLWLDWDFHRRMRNEP
jgi:hypothetical protein